MVIAAVVIAGGIVASAATITTTFTKTITASSQSPITFLIQPTQCYIEGLCVNATLVNHIGENLTIILAAWFQNSTTGQNITITGGGKGSMGYATCSANWAKPSTCYLIASSTASGTLRVTVWAVATDGKTVLSPSATITIT